MNSRKRLNDVNSPCSLYIVLQNHRTFETQIRLPLSRCAVNRDVFLTWRELTVVDSLINRKRRFRHGCMVIHDEWLQDTDNRADYRLRKGVDEIFAFLVHARAQSVERSTALVKMLHDVQCQGNESEIIYILGAADQSKAHGLLYKSLYHSYRHVFE